MDNVFKAVGSMVSSWPDWVHDALRICSPFEASISMARVGTTLWHIRDIFYKPGDERYDLLTHWASTMDTAYERLGPYGDMYGITLRNTFYFKTTSTPKE